MLEARFHVKTGLSSMSSCHGPYVFFLQDVHASHKPFPITLSVELLIYWTMKLLLIGNNFTKRDFVECLVRTIGRKSRYFMHYRRIMMFTLM